MRIEFEVKINKEDETIEIDSYSVHEELRNKLATEAMDLKEELIKKALMELGWTPPKKDKQCLVEQKH